MTDFVGTPGRLDAVVAAVAGLSRADAQRAIAAGGVQVDGVARPKSFRLDGGERLTVDAVSAFVLEPWADGPDVPVRYEDEHLAVVSKPAGIATHPTAAKRSGTLVNRLLAMGMPLADVGDPLRPGIVHRLDAGTSGLLIIAKDQAASVGLQKMMRGHETDRRYLALVRGVVEHERFIVDAPLQRHRAKIVVRTATGRAAETEFAVRERYERATYLEAAPRTGRTHQIRVHLRAIDHPILGDGRYGGGGDDAKALGLKRPFLHAWRLTFTEPITGERVEVEDPLPDDLTQALEREIQAQTSG